MNNEETVREIWNHIKKNDDRYRYKAFDGDNDDIINNISNMQRINNILVNHGTDFKNITQNQ